MGLLEQNESLVEDMQNLLTKLLEEKLVEQDIFSEYWANIQRTREVEGAELIVMQEQSKEAGLDHADAVAKLKVAESEMQDVNQKAKWAAEELQNARCGNQPSADEVLREKAAVAYNNKMLALKLQRTKVLEMCHKRQVTSLNTREAADRALAEKTNQMRPLELMNRNGQTFFEAMINPLPKASTDAVTPAVSIAAAA